MKIRRKRRKCKEKGEMTKEEEKMQRKGRKDHEKRDKTEE